MTNALETKKAEALANLARPANRERFNDETYSAEVDRISQMWDGAIQEQRKKRIIGSLVAVVGVAGLIIYPMLHHSGPTQNDIAACGALNGSLESVANNIPADWSQVISWGQEANDPKIVSAANSLAQNTSPASDTSALSAYGTACTNLGIGPTSSNTGG